MRLTDLKGIGNKTAQLLNKLSVYTAEDLMTFYPRSYDIYERPVLVSQLPECAGMPSVAIDAVVAKTPGLRKVRNLQILTTQLRDEKGGLISAVWFNMPYLIHSLKLGCRYIFRGHAVFRDGIWKLEQPELYTMEGYSSKIGIMQPIYPLTKGLSNKLVTKAVAQTLDIEDLKTDYMPDDIRNAYELAETNFALQNIHFPASADDYELARRRIIFDEFFMFILNVRMMKKKNEAMVNRMIIENAYATDQFINKLPYRLTDAQLNAWSEIKKDMAGSRVMNRLVQGDVGSGKTIIAVLALLNTVYSGYQGAMMVPTEVLALQQYQDINNMLAGQNINIQTQLLIGSMTAAQKKEARERIADGTAQIIIGTHALIQDKVEYNNLALVITDEQHRFGVNQRESLAKKGADPHMLVMSATPIPRTLALIIYGDLDISVINQLPGNRVPIKNCVVDTGYRPNAYKFIENQVRKGRQAYVICPMVEANKDGEVMEDGRGDSYAETNFSSTLENVVDYASRLCHELPSDICVEYLHGKMKPAMKNEIMERFHTMQTQVLVSTTVIEVGVNVPNASVMMIENADRFGLAQLHQLRGRVGRGGYQSYCIFVGSPNASADNLERLNVLRDSNDGFKIAEEDLKLRGPGDFFGIRQSGDMHFVLADIYQDAAVLKQASEAVDRILEEDCELTADNHSNLKNYLERWQKADVVL